MGSSAKPEGGVDYPRNFVEVDESLVGGISSGGKRERGKENK